MAATMTAQVQVHGHRGARAARPENTIPAFEYALAAGVDVLELDLAVTKDNIVVVSHDATMNPAYCAGPDGAERVIRRMTLAELQRWDCGARANPQFPQQQAIPGTRVPTLDAVFTLAKAARVEFNIETKMTPAHPEWAPEPEEFARLVLAVINRHGLAPRVILQSFDYRTLLAMERLAPQIRRSALLPARREEAGRDYVEAARAAKATIVSPIYPTVTPEKVAAAHAAGLQVVPWTANTPADWEKLVAAKVDANITDDPAALIAYLKQRKLR
jgi:glycerophosphoryl diester phosphodiesterase